VKQAREIMHQGDDWISPHETMLDAARKMRDLNVGSLPICDADGVLVGIVTDHDIVVRCLAEGAEPSQFRASAFAWGFPVSVPPDANEDDVVREMQSNAVRHLPVIEDGQLIGIISESDISRSLPKKEVARFVDAVSA
jgi:CBS domain-containing protein